MKMMRCTACNLRAENPLYVKIMFTNKCYIQVICFSKTRKRGVIDGR